MIDKLDAKRLVASPLAASVELHETLGSTNDRAKELVASNVEPPVLVVANRQTAGRGRGANRWWSAEGGLTFSLLLETGKKGLRTEQIGLASLATALAIGDAARELASVDCGFKWPNDVYLAGKKLAGVLLESPLPGRLVIGVGVNVGVDFADAPEEVRSSATSLAEQVEAPMSRQAFLEKLLETLEARLSQCVSSSSRLVDDARSACILTGRMLMIEQAGQPFTARCLGLADDGALLMELNGNTRRIVSGTVRLADQKE